MNHQGQASPISMEIKLQARKGSSLLNYQTKNLLSISQGSLPSFSTSIIIWNLRIVWVNLIQARIRIQALIVLQRSHHTEILIKAKKAEKFQKEGHSLRIKHQLILHKTFNLSQSLILIWDLENLQWIRIGLCLPLQVIKVAWAGKRRLLKS